MHSLAFTRRNKRFSPWIGSLEPRWLLLTAVPDIKMVSTTETSFSTVTVNYDVEAAVTSFRVAIYRGATPQLNTQIDQLITTTTLSGPNDSLGDHTGVPITISGGLEPDPIQPYVIAVATGPDNQSTDADFEAVVIAAVSHGLELPGTSLPPAWETQMVDSLRNEHFNDVIEWTWNYSWVPKAGVATNAGDGLAQAIEQAVKNPQIVPNGAIVDIELIGHSRGAVVVNQAFTDLQAAASTIPQLNGGCWRETLLDPHPANSATDDLLGYNPKSDISTAAFYAAEALQYGMDDPYPIKVPSMVSEVQDYYQHTDVTNLGSYWGFFSALYTENYLDPQGVGPGPGLVLLGKNTILNSQLLTSNGIGHGEVHEWYQQFVVPTLDTDKPFVTGPVDAPLRPETYIPLLSFKSVDSDYLVRFEDADPTSNPADYSISINWGDMTKASKGTAIKSTILGGFDVHGTHTYASTGTYSVSVTIKDIAPKGGGWTITLPNTIRVI